jgi:uncharacterized lipoprotein YmbA
MAACHSAPTRLYMLEPIAPLIAPGAYQGPAIRVEAIHVPPALDRMEIVSEVAPGEFKVSDVDQWMAPLGQGVRQTLTADLAARLPQGRVIFPHLAKPPGTISINVEVLAFTADRRGAELQVSWVGSSEGAPPRTRGGTLMLHTDLSGASSASMVVALSTLLAQLADRIVAELSEPVAADAS